jgi:probable HAF family extracellular repeat protein
MKSRFATYLFPISLMAGLTVPVGIAAHDAVQNPRKHHHYKLIDMGTFGGDASYVNFGARVLNDAGMVAGSSETSTPEAASTNPFPCPGPNVFTAFGWWHGSVVDLGTIPGGNCSNAIWINNHGDMAGDSENGQVDPLTGINEVHAVVWHNGEIKDLGTFGGSHSAAQAINDGGQVTGFAMNDIPDPYSLFDIPFLAASTGTQTRAFLFHDGAMEDIGTLGGPDAMSWFVNNQGQVAGFSYTDSTPNDVTGSPTLHPFLWQNGKMKDLGTLGGFGSILSTSSAPVVVNGLNNRGAVIGFSPLAGDQASDPFLWDGENLIDLYTQSEGTFLSPNVINDRGEVAGLGAFANRPNDAALWSNGAVTDLGALGPDCYSEAWAIGSKGQVGGVSVSCDGNIWRAFLWENGSMVDLNTLIGPDPGLQLIYAIGINEHGEIAGNGVPPGASTALDQDTLSHAFLLIPCDENHPGIEGCDYSVIDGSDLAFRPVPVVGGAASRTLPQSLMRRMNRYRFPGLATGPRN